MRVFHSVGMGAVQVESFYPCEQICFGGAGVKHFSVPRI